MVRIYGLGNLIGVNDIISENIAIDKKSYQDIVYKRCKTIAHYFFFKKEFLEDDDDDQKQNK